MIIVLSIFVGERYQKVHLPTCVMTIPSPLPNEAVPGLIINM